MTEKNEIVVAAKRSRSMAVLAWFARPVPLFILCFAVNLVLQVKWEPVNWGVAMICWAALMLMTLAALMLAHTETNGWWKKIHRFVTPLQIPLPVLLCAFIFPTSLGFSRAKDVCGVECNSWSAILIRANAKTQEIAEVMTVPQWRWRPCWTAACAAAVSLTEISFDVGVEFNSKEGDPFSAEASFNTALTTDEKSLVAYVKGYQFDRRNQPSIDDALHKAARACVQRNMAQYGTREIVLGKTNVDCGQDQDRTLPMSFSFTKLSVRPPPALVAIAAAR